MPPQLPYLLSGIITNGVANETVVVIKNANTGDTASITVDGNKQYVYDLANLTNGYSNGDVVSVEVYDPAAKFEVKIWDSTNDLIIDQFKSIQSTNASTSGHARVLYQGKGLAIRESKIKFEILNSEATGDFELLMNWY